MLDDEEAGSLRFSESARSWVFLVVLVWGPKTLDGEKVRLRETNPC